MKINSFEEVNVDGRKSAKIIISLGVFPLEVIYSASYILLDKAHILLDKKKDDEIEVLIIPKTDREKLDELVYRFNDELINYSVYAVQAARNSSLRKAIVERALNFFETYEEPEAQPEETEEVCEECEDYKEYEEDPLGIMEPWTPEKAEGLKTPEELEKEILGIEDE